MFKLRPRYSPDAPAIRPRECDRIARWHDHPDAPHNLDPGFVCGLSPKTRED